MGRWMGGMVLVLLMLGSTVAGAQAADALPGAAGVQAMAYVDAHTRVIALDGTMLAPLTLLADLAGAAVGYDAETRAVSVHGLDHSLTLRAGSQAMLVDGTPRRLPVPARVYHGVTYAPVRAVAERLGLLVGWNAPQQTIYLTDRTHGERARLPVAIFLTAQGEGRWQRAAQDAAWTALPAEARPLAQRALGKSATQYAAWLKTHPHQ